MVVKSKNFIMAIMASFNNIKVHEYTKLKIIDNFVLKKTNYNKLKKLYGSQVFQQWL